MAVEAKHAATWHCFHPLQAVAQVASMSLHRHSPCAEEYMTSAHHRNTCRILQAMSEQYALVTRPGRHRHWHIVAHLSGNHT